MSPVAYLYVERPSGLVDYIVADECEVDQGVVKVTGHVRRPSGRLEERRSYSWPVRRVLEIQWQEHRHLAVVA